MRHRRSRRLDVAPEMAGAPVADRRPDAASGCPDPAAPQLWLALHLPLLSLEAWRATLDAAAQARPLVLLAEHRVSHLDAAAAARGNRPGMKRATALALAADLLPGAADAARDAVALQAVAHAALAFTPSVALEGEATVLLEVRSCLRLFGGFGSLLARLEAALAPLGHQVEIAAAPTALGAALLARWGALRPLSTSASTSLAPDVVAALRTPTRGAHVTQPRALAALLAAAPVWLLGPGREHWEALEGMGLRTLADLRALPRSGLARRFGAGLLDDLDRALGQRPDPRCWLEPPLHFASRLELFARAENAEQVLAGAAVLLARLVAWAQARHGRIGAFTLAMRHEPRHGAAVPATELRVELAEPALDPAHLQLLLRERLAQVTLAAPTLELELRCRHLEAGAPPNGELFPTRASAGQGLLRLLERLRARLGDAQVQRLVPVADHRPGPASRAVPALGEGGAAVSRAGAVAAAVACGHLHRPAFVLPEPLPLAERDGVPTLEGAPLQLLAGPERIESGWWDGDLVVRDYFIAAAPDGALVWVWRERLPAGAASVTTGAARAVSSATGYSGAVSITTGPWFLQGRFA